jgi:gliding motility-associated-like protein
MVTNCSPLKTMRPLFIFLFVLVAFQSFSQAPVVTNVEPLVTFPNDTIFITGNGFSSNEADLQVWFGSVRGTILQSTDFLIEVIVPPSATVCNIEVMNLVTKTSGRSLERFMSSYSGTGFSTTKFAAPVQFSYNLEQAWDLCSCDFNNDGKPDIAGTKYTSGPNLAILRNTSSPGTISFTQTLFSLGFGTENIQCSDLDGDGKSDLVITRTGNERYELYILKNTTTDPNNITFTAIGSAIKLKLEFVLNGVTEAATRVSLFDLNKDGKSDIVVTNFSDAVNLDGSTGQNGVLYVFTNKSSAGTLSFLETDRVRIVIPGITTYESAVQDFNNDGFPDIMFNRWLTNDLYILENKGTSTISFENPVMIPVSGTFNRMVNYDFNSDGLQDLVMTSTSTDRLALMMNTSTGGNFAFSTQPQIVTGDGPWGIDINDVDGDGDADLAVANRDEASLSIFLNNGAATPSFTINTLATSNLLPTRNIKLQDFDGDGKPDIAYTSFRETPVASTISILRNQNCHQPVILNEPPLSICNSQTVRLQTIPAINVTYTWKDENSTTVGTNSPNFDLTGITSDKTYTVTATNVADGCAIVSAPIAVDYINAASVGTPNFTTNAPLCSGEVLTLQSSTVGTSYVWTGPGGFEQTTATGTYTFPSPSDASSAGEYGVVVKNSSGCASTLKTATVEVVNLADFTITSDNLYTQICTGTPVALSVNDADNHSYKWYKDNVLIAAQTNPSLTVTATGSYHVVIKHDILGCELPIDPVALTYFTKPVAAFVVPDGCAGEIISFDNQSTIDAGATKIYTWTFGDAESSSIEEPTHQYATNGAFTAKLKIDYQNTSGCVSNEASDIVNIQSAIVPVISSTKAEACAEEEVTLSLNASFTSVTWSTTETSSTIDVVPGPYNVNTVDANGCPGFDDITITALTSPVVTVTADDPTIAAGGIAQLTAAPADFVSYLWTPSEGLSATTISNPTATPVVTTTYLLQVTNDAGCAGEAQITITVEGVSGFPAAFSPNGDGENEIWNIKAESMPDCSLTIFDGRGRRVFEKKGENWDGTYNGTAVPDGTYYYVFSCPAGKPVTGAVLVFR